jgi:hypothetical protein
MKILLILLFCPIPSFAIELVINGITYNIREYKIENNGKRIVVNHDTLPGAKGRGLAQSPKRKLIRVRKTRAFAPPKSKRGNAFQNLLRELSSSPKQDTKNRNYQ